ANVLVRFSRKVTDVIDKDHEISHVEIEVDHKFARSLEPSRMVLDLASETPLRLEPLEDLLGLQQIRDRLGIDWTARDLGEALDVPKTSVLRKTGHRVDGARQTGHRLDDARSRRSPGRAQNERVATAAKIVGGRPRRESGRRQARPRRQARALQV